MTAAIYARFSSSLQRPTSVHDQIALCQLAAEQRGYKVSSNHVFTDAELSGAISQRPGYQQLLAAARNRDVDAVFVESQDRLWRDQAEMHAAIRRFCFWDVRVFSVTANSELTEKTGKLLASVMGWKDEAYLEDLREKVRRGMLGQVQRGFSPGGRAYGYRTEPITDPSRTDHYGRPLIVGSRRAVDLDEAAVVRRIFEMFTSGLSPDAIARQLNRDGVPAPRWRNGKRLPGWVPSTIRGQKKLAFGILRNPIYVGRPVWNRAQKMRDPDTGRRVWRLRPPEQWVSKDIPELRIISDEVWGRAQHRLLTTPYGPKQPAGRKPHYLLSGLCVCGVCHSAYVIVSGRGWYGCGGYHKRGETVCTNRLLAKRGSLEEQVLAIVQEQMLAPAALEEFARHFNQVLHDRLRQQGPMGRDSRRALARAEAELENIKAAIRAGVVTATTRTMLEEAEAKVAGLRADAKDAGPAAKSILRLLPSAAARFVADLRRLAAHNVPKARLLLEDFLGQIVLNPQGDLLKAAVQGNLAAILPIEAKPLGYNRGAGGRT